MINVYANGIDFYEENKTILLANEYTEPFFRLDYPLLTKAGKEEYAIRVQEGNACLLAMCVEPYSILLHGDKSLSSELVLFLTSNGYRIKDYLCSIELGEELIPLFQSKGYDFHLSLGMDFMEADRKTSEPLNAVVHPSADDVDQLFEMTCNFIKDCGLTDIAKKERILENLANYRIAEAASQKYSKDFLWKCTLYTSAEPCAMCTGAIYWANIGRIVYAMTEKRLLQLTGSNEQNPTFNMPCRTILKTGQKPIEVLGPFEEVEVEAAEFHKGYWD